MLFGTVYRYSYRCSDGTEYVEYVVIKLLLLRHSLIPFPHHVEGEVCGKSYLDG
jgi:hypothetical protein